MMILVFNTCGAWSVQIETPERVFAGVQGRPEPFICSPLFGSPFRRLTITYWASVLVLSSGGTVFHERRTALVCAMCTAIYLVALLHAVSDDPAITVGANRCKGLNCAFETIERVRVASHRDVERLVVFVPALFASGPGFSFRVDFIKRRRHGGLEGSWRPCERRREPAYFRLKAQRHLGNWHTC